MRIPHCDSRANRVAKYLYAVDGATKQQCMTAFSDEPSVKIREAINYMHSESMLSERDGVYRVKPYLAAHYAQSEKAIEQLPIVPPRAAPEFRPMSAKYMLPKEPPRDDAQPLRDWSCKTGSVGFPVGYQS